MKDKLHIGYVEWVKNAEYGMLYDLEAHKSFFCHRSKNPLIVSLIKDDYILFKTYLDKKRNQECGEDVIKLTDIEDKSLINDLIIRFGPPLENPKMNQIERIYSGYKSSDIEKIVGQLKRQLDVIDYCSEQKLRQIQSDPSLIEGYISDDKFFLLKREKVVQYFHNYAQEHIVELLKKKSVLLSSFNDETGAKIFDKIIYETEKIDSLELFENAVDLIDKSLTIGPLTCEKLTNHFFNVATPIFKLKMWLRVNYNGDILPYLEDTFMTLDEVMLNQVYRKLSAETREEIVKTLLGKKLTEIPLISSVVVDFIRTGFYQK